MSEEAPTVNTITGNLIDKSILQLFMGPAKDTMTISPSNVLYYYFVAEKRAMEHKNPFDPATISFVGDIEASHFYKFTVPSDASKELLIEIEFMKDLGLAFEENKTVYIYDIAVVLYGPTGYFKNAGSVGAKQAFLGVLYNYVLPGHFWTAYATRSHLPDGIQLSTGLETRMRELFDMVWDIVR